MKGIPSVTRRLEIVPISDVTAEEVDYLIAPYIPIGAITVLEGDPESGKTYTALDIAARVTTGKPAPWLIPVVGEQVTPPASVLYATGEDHVAGTLKPRLVNCGGDPRRFYSLKGVIDESDDGEIRQMAFNLGDKGLLDKAFEECQPKLFVIDPLQAFLGAGVDMHKANEVRPVLSGIAELAEKHRCAVLIIRHLNKSSQQRAAYRGMGSIDITGAARSVLLAGKHPHDPNRFALVHTKTNLGRKGKALTYSIDDDGLHWHGREDVTADDVLQPPMAVTDRLTAAKQFLENVLADGPKPSTEVTEAARRAGISGRALNLAKEELGVMQRPAGFQKGWIWCLRSIPDTKEGFGPENSESPAITSGLPECESLAA